MKPARTCLATHLYKCKQSIGVKTFLPKSHTAHTTDLTTNFSSAMGPANSLFSRACPGPKVNIPQPEPNKPKNFFSLPGELRNQIYEYYFQDTFYRCDLSTQDSVLSPLPNRKVQIVRNIPAASSKSSRRKRKQQLRTPVKLITIYFASRTIPEDQPPIEHWLTTNVALVLCNKQMHAETLQLLYRHMTFFITSPSRMASFLAKTPAPNRAFVTCLHLSYTTYGSPAARRDVVWQQRHLKAWTRACSAAVTELPGLRKLHIQVYLSEAAPKFNLTRDWLQPLWEFKRIAAPRTQSVSAAPVTTATTTTTTTTTATATTSTTAPPTSTPQSKHSSSSPAPATQAGTLTSVKVCVKSRLYTHTFAHNARLAVACKDLHHLYGLAISDAIQGMSDDEAMKDWEEAWEGRHACWKHHLGFGKTGW